MPDTDTSGHTDDEDGLPDFEYGATINTYSPNQGEEKEKEDNLNVYDAVDFIADDNMIDESIEASKSGKKDKDKPAKAGENEFEEEEDNHEANTGPNADINSDNMIDESIETSKSGKKDKDKPADAEDGEDEFEEEANTDPDADVKSDNMIDETSKTSKSGKKDKDKPADAEDGEDEFEEEANTDPDADVDSVTTIAGQDPIADTILDEEGQKLPSSPTGNDENEDKDEDGGKSYHINI